MYLADKLAPEKPKEKPVERTPVKVAPAIYDAYVGRYLMEPAMLISITKENDQLFGQPSGQPKLELIPESETKYSIKGAPVDTSIEFHRDEKGRAIRLTLVQRGQATSARRVEPVSLTSNEMAEYAGDYYSEELGTTYTVVVQDGKLIAQHRRHDDIALSPLDSDLFSGDRWWFRQVRFVRGKENRVTGFKLTGGRVRNMRFEKQTK